MPEDQRTSNEFLNSTVDGIGETAVNAVVAINSDSIATEQEERGRRLATLRDPGHKIQQLMWAVRKEMHK